MRILFAVHGFPPFERTGVENHVAELAAALVRAGHEVHVFAPRVHPRRAHLALRTEERDGYRLHWLTLNEPPRSASDHLEPPGVAEVFDELLARLAPEIVHVHHVHKLGIGVLLAAKARGLPLCFTAHDYAALCHRTVMLRPDLSRCSTIGDVQACARCDLAVSHLNGLRGLGDYHAGVFARDLERPSSRRLAEILEGEFGGRGFERAVRERGELDARRREAYLAVDRVFSPSRFAAERLVRAGFAADSVRVQPIAIDSSELQRVARPDPRHLGPLHFAFVGGVTKHKGLHVLLEAFRGAGPRAKLSVFGDSSDRAWVARLRGLARGLGVHWHGAFEARERASVFASFDVLCVPSVWDENAPLVIREAFAAGRPVLASRIGALEESVRDSIDGRLIAANDVDAWRATLRAWSLDRAEFERLAAGVSPPRTIEDLAGELVSHYREMTPAPRAVPAHLEVFAARYRELAHEDFDALARRVAQGLERLARRVDPERASSFAAAVDADGAEALRDLARDRRAELRWLHRSLDGARGVREELSAARRELEQTRQAHARERRERAEAFEALRRAHEELTREYQAVLGERDALAAAKLALESEVEWRKRSLAELEQKAAEAQRARTELESEIRARRSEIARLELDVAAHAKHEVWLASKAGDLARELDGGDAKSPKELEAAIDRAHAMLRGLRAELAWRRGEMSAATADGGAFARSLIDRSALGRRLRDWRAKERGEP